MCPDDMQQTCSNAMMDAASEAATDAAALAFFHRHYSIKIFGRPPNLRGATYKKNISVGTSRL